MGWVNRLFGKEAKGTMKTAMKEQEKEVIKMAKDLVCGMDVDEKKAPAKSEYQGKTYYFCAPGCKKAFDANPAKYIKGGGPATTGHGGHRM
ncbi:MAG: hypothetical protein HW402_1254 [Dehalococcoidales bacterium]|nr:hypothetical protein [Dehalococcoidales bacterium]